MRSRLKKWLLPIVAVAAFGVMASASPQPSVGLYFYFTGNPTTGGGQSAPMWQLGIRTDVPSLYYKSGTGNTAWTLIASGSGGVIGTCATLNAIAKWTGATTLDCSVAIDNGTTYSIGTGFIVTEADGALALNAAASTTIGAGKITRTFDTTGGGWELWGTVDPTDIGVGAHYSAQFATAFNTPLGHGFDHTGSPICWNFASADPSQPDICRGDIESHWGTNTEQYDRIITLDGAEHRWFGSTDNWDGSFAQTFLDGSEITFGDWTPAGAGAVVQINTSPTPTSTSSNMQLGGLVAGYKGTTLTVEDAITTENVLEIGTPSAPSQYLSIGAAGMIQAATVFAGATANFNQEAIGADAYLQLDTRNGNTTYYTQRSGGQSEVQAANGTLLLESSNFVRLAPVNTVTEQLSTTLVNIASAAVVGFADTGDATNIPDTGIARHAAGVLEVDNGTAGTLANLIANKVTVQTGTGQAALIATTRAASTDGENICIGGGCQSVAFDGTNTFSGSYNTALGEQTLVALTTGNDNTAVGESAANLLTSGQQNTAIGFGALDTATTASYMTAIGQFAMQSMIGDVDDTCVGVLCMQNISAGSGNVAVGVQALQGGSASTSTKQNVAIGLDAEQSIETGFGNIAIGYLADQNDTTGIANVVVGREGFLANQSGFADTGVGGSVMAALTSGSGDSAFGGLAGSGVTTGSFNSFLGYQSGGGVTTGSNNTILGANIGGLSAALSNNVIIGDGSGHIRIQDTGSLTELFNPVALETAGSYFQLIQQSGTATAPKEYAFAGNPNGVISCTKGDIAIDTSTSTSGAIWQCTSGTTWTQVGASSGGVTSIACGTNMTCSPGSPITTTGTVSVIASPTFSNLTMSGTLENSGATNSIYADDGVIVSGKSPGGGVAGTANSGIQSWVASGGCTGNGCSDTLQLRNSAGNQASGGGPMVTFWVSTGSSPGSTGLGAEIKVKKADGTTTPSGIFQVYTGTTSGSFIEAVQYDANQHVQYPSTVVGSPTSCGVTGASSGGTDIAGSALTGTAATSCTIPWGRAYATAPVCLVVEATTPTIVSWTEGTANLVVNFSAGAQHSIRWSCSGGS